MNFAENLRLLRKENNLTQKNLADFLKVSKFTISHWELGDSFPSIDFIKTLATFFNVSTDYLLGLEDDFGTKTEKPVINKISSEDFSPEEIDMIKKIRQLGPYEQTYIKAQIDALSDTIKSKQKDKI